MPDSAWLCLYSASAVRISTSSIPESTPKGHILIHPSKQALGWASPSEECDRHTVALNATDLSNETFATDYRDCPLATSGLRRLCKANGFFPRGISSSRAIASRPRMAHPTSTRSNLRQRRLQPACSRPCATSSCSQHRESTLSLVASAGQSIS